MSRSEGDVGLSLIKAFGGFAASLFSAVFAGLDLLLIKVARNARHRKWAEEDEAALEHLRPKYETKQLADAIGKLIEAASVS